MLIYPVQNAVGQISFTCDVWSDQNQWSFLAITAHWIARVGQKSSLELKTALIAFQGLSGSHTGELLVDTVLTLLDRANATNKVSTTA
jgi:hypothetical protein